MKQLTCEMCGSTDLMKDGGVFVCQTCGCKYSVEEAKKMMIEGTVDVSGSTVKVDTTARLKNLYTLARRAKADNNIQDAAKYYNEIRIEDPNSWEAAFYGVYFTALNCKIAEIQSAANSITNNIDTVSELILKYVPEEEQKAAYTECLIRSASAGKLMYSSAMSAYTEATRYDSNMGARNDFINRGTASMTIILTAVIAAEEKFNDYELAQTIHSSTDGMFGLIAKEFIDIIQNRIDALKPKIRALQQKKNEEYWKEHAKEKREYDARIEEINSEIRHLQTQLKQYDSQITEIKKDLQQYIPGESQLVELKRQQYDLYSQKSRLGLFASKQKKALQEQIDSMNLQISSIEETVKRQKKIIQDDVEKRIRAVEGECKPIKDKIRSLENEKYVIYNELSKDR